MSDVATAGEMELKAEAAAEPEPVVETLPPVEVPLPPIETKLIPIELHGINLSIELRVPVKTGESFAETQSIIARLRQKFGEDVLIEELQQVICGSIEKVTISSPKPIVGPGNNEPVVTQGVNPITPPAQPGPQIAPEVANYQVQSKQCPWTGQSLKMLDPASIYKVLYESVQHKGLMTAQDISYMEAYYAQWYQVQTAKAAQPASQPVQQTITFAEDNLPGYR